MIIDVDPAAATPPYEQLRGQLTTMIEAGALAAGQRLPSIRQLAADLGLAPGTVSRAYGELERDGLIRTRRGRHGSVVLDGRAALPGAERERQVAEEARRFALRARQLGVDSSQALALVREAFTTLRP